MRRIGPYELREELGRGGLGQVWRAWDPGLQREVALKVLLREGWQLEPEERERFAREAQAQARVEDPGLAEVFQLDLLANPPYLVMELVPGETLAARLKREGPLPPPEALRIGLELAGTLARLHRAGVVHRDLKPQNVIVRPDGRPVLLDLGLALLLDRSARLTVSGEVMGTPGYLPPEQAAGQARDMGPAADVYGLGALLFALLTGEPPFRGDALEALQGVLSRPAPVPSALRPGLPAALDELVARCLRKEPVRRPAAEELVRALTALQGIALARAPARRWTRAGPLLALALAGAAALVWRVGGPGTMTPAPVTAQALCAHGEALLRAGLAVPAIALFDRALALDPRCAPAHLGRGSARFGLGQWEAAIADLDRADDLGLRDAGLYLDRGSARCLLGRYQEALGDFEQASLLAPHRPHAFHNLGLTRVRLGQPERALEDFDRALALGDYAVGLADRGATLLRLGRREAALRDFDRALALEPDLVDALLNRCMMRAKAGRAGDALADVERALQRAPDQPLTHQAHGNVLAELGRYPEAIAAFERVMRLDPSSAPAFLQRGFARGQLKEWEGAIADSTRALELDPELASAALHNRATALRAAGRLVDALKDFDELVRLRPGDPPGLYQRGMLRAALRDYPRAIEDFDRALELQPDALLAAELRSARRRAAAALAPR